MLIIRQLSDADLCDDITFARAVMETDSQVDDVWIEHESIDASFTLRDLLAEAARRATLVR